MRKIIIIAISILTFNLAYSQDEIQVPVFDYVEVDYDLRDYVLITIDKTGAIKVEDKVVDLEELRTSLTQALIDKSKHKGLRLSISTIELLADRELEFQKLNPLLTEIRKMGMLKIHLVSNSEFIQRIDGVKTCGFLYKLNSIEDSKPIMSEVVDSFNRVSENRKKPQGAMNNMPPPPPPPPPPPREINAADLRNGEIAITVKEINITRDGFKINKQTYNIEELRDQMTGWNSFEPTAYILSPDANCSYEQFIRPLAELKLIIKTLRDEESHKLYSSKYKLLNREGKRQVRKKYPFLMVIED